MSNGTRLTHEICSTMLATMMGSQTMHGMATRYMMTLVLSCLPLLAVVGNTLVILSVAMFSHMQTLTNAFVVSLAVADLCVATLVMPYDIYMNFTNRVWSLGRTSCLVAHSFCVMTCTASIYNLCCLALDRYLAMCRPFLRLSSSVAVALLLACWLMPALLSFVPIMNRWNHIDIDDVVHCMHVLKQGQDCELVFNRRFALVGFVVAFLVPLLLMGILNWRIYLAAARHLKEVVHVQKVGAGRRDSKTQNERIAKALGIIMACFGVCWSPFFVCGVVNPFVRYTIPHDLWTFAKWAGFVNSVINPLLLYSFNKRFHRAFCRLLNSFVLCSRRKR
ncbi:5-hydroxytryptamine receptor 4-like [Gigantopelta aegis]|uniref:5-hydroxytryptamine receptor 4-like n=1 Tax=Gigantopelta aegis TaxID=1735272 RepID=UPI001B889BCF|nr:5-hydroxytryptamine receptor 4-like [Gigantopelta aegis]